MTTRLRATSTHRGRLYHSASASIDMCTALALSLARDLESSGEATPASPPPPSKCALAASASRRFTAPISVARRLQLPHRSPLCPSAFPSLPLPSPPWRPFRLPRRWQLGCVGSPPPHLPPSQMGRAVTVAAGTQDFSSEQKEKGEAHSSPTPVPPLASENEKNERKQHTQLKYQDARVNRTGSRSSAGGDQPTLPPDPDAHVDFDRRPSAPPIARHPFSICQHPATALPLLALSSSTLRLRTVAFAHLRRTAFTPSSPRRNHTKWHASAPPRRRAVHTDGTTPPLSALPPSLMLHHTTPLSLYPTLPTPSPPLPHTSILPRFCTPPSSPHRPPRLPHALAPANPNHRTKMRTRTDSPSRLFPRYTLIVSAGAGDVHGRAAAKSSPSRTKDLERNSRRLLYPRAPAPRHPPLSRANANEKSAHHARPRHSDSLQHKKAQTPRSQQANEVLPDHDDAPSTTKVLEFEPRLLTTTSTRSLRLHRAAAARHKVAPKAKAEPKVGVCRAKQRLEWNGMELTRYDDEELPGGDSAPRLSRCLPPETRRVTTRLWKWALSRRTHATWQERGTGLRRRAHTHTAASSAKPHSSSRLCTDAGTYTRRALPLPSSLGATLHPVAQQPARHSEDEDEDQKWGEAQTNTPKRREQTRNRQTKTYPIPIPRPCVFRRRRLSFVVGRVGVGQQRGRLASWSGTLTKMTRTRFGVSSMSCVSEIHKRRYSPPRGGGAWWCTVKNVDAHVLRG
ncbi:hypothetical protein C8R45DRAFT_1091573 [Mycena sanguinolenta]|nr:hypothetical protein C8R45DRAFT_1091573 [Mycena sanguinolenta]